jgi:hypothetical protein
MLCVFSKPKELSCSPASPAGCKRRLTEYQSLAPEEEEYVSGVLDNLYSSVPKRSHAYINEHYFGGGAHGIAYCESLTSSLVTDPEGDVSVFFKGTLANNPDDCEDAEFILQEYKRCFDRADVGMGGATPTMEVLSQLHGPWAFVIYDRSHVRIVAARDPAGEELLAWGTTMLSEGVMFASSKAIIDGECADADDFPPGAVFVSEDFSTLGTLTPISSEGADEAAAQQELLCRVESSSDLRKEESQSEVAAN